MTLFDENLFSVAANKGEPSTAAVSPFRHEPIVNDFRQTRY